MLRRRVMSSPRCWNCNSHLNGDPVEYGEELKLEIIDIHANGCGLGRNRWCPSACTSPSQITKVRDNLAYAEEGERLELEPEVDEDEEKSGETTGDDASDDEEEPLGSRENFWGPTE